MRLGITFLVICLMQMPDRSRQEQDEYLRLPHGFTIGVGGSAYQIEGGWNASDKGESVWDRKLHTQPWKIMDRSNGDTACDSYHKYKEDVQWVKHIGLGHYRFSISWSRILPNGRPSSLSQDGLRYYHNLIDELLANDIEPSVLLYHWDHPQALEDMGGWTNESMVEWFTDYADIVFREFGPKVKVFTTINEPKVFCFLLYDVGWDSPDRILNTSRPAYVCGHNVLKAHARAYHLYDQKYRADQNGKVGIVTVCSSYYPKAPNDTLLAETLFQFSCGWISHPVFLGDYPQLLKTKLAEMSRDAGLPGSVLPTFSPEWIETIRGTSDYFGLNHYTSVQVERGPDSIHGSADDFLPRLGISRTFDPIWERAHGMKRSVPQGFGDLLRRIKKEYNNPPVFIMENGKFTDPGILNDYERIKYLHSYLKELLLAVHRDGCNVQKYTVWSLMDGFEWNFGYSGMPYGLLYINFSNPDLERVPKLSVTWLQNVMRTRQLQPPILSPANSTVLR